MRQRVNAAAIAVRGPALGPWLAGAIIAFALAFAVSARAEDQKEQDYEPDALAFGAGYYDVLRAMRNKPDAMTAGLLNLEYRSDKKLWYFRPQIGAWATNQGSAYVYAGIRLDVFIGNRFVFTPSFSPGLYIDGNGKDLGFPVEFRSSAEFAYRFDDYSRISLGIAHLSNASLSKVAKDSPIAGNGKNPGVETLTLSYSVPIRNLLGN